MQERIYIVIITLLLTSPVWAGSQQAGEAQFTLENIATLTKKVETTMAEKGARVFIIGRNGRPVDELPTGVKYTHVAFGVYSKIQTVDGRIIPGYAFYNLYQEEKNGAKSKLVTDYAVDFLTGIYESRVGIIIPTPALQMRLLNLVGTAEYESLHNPDYSVMSNPYNAKYQNCTEYVLDVVNAAIYKTVDRQELKLSAQDYFKAHDIHVSPFTTLLGSMFVAGVQKDDHVGQIKTATYTTIANYLVSFNLVQEVIELKL
ncbi:hypothetical protein A9Q78_07635 [Methylophaga sp. 41_12_T18]|nr:hypothetical protein A9Q78_07635 [Methylophaga sp. 41_12_T18]